jgi:hypothetical protein
MIPNMEPRRETSPSPSAPAVTLAQIKAALEDVPVNRLADVYAYLIELQEDAVDLAAIEAARNEPTIPFDQVLEENDISHEMLEAVAVRLSETLKVAHTIF